AYNLGDSRYPIASAWFEGLMNGSERACFCWETINGFIRISTNPVAMPNPYSLTEAHTIVRSWLTSPNALFLHPSEDHLDVIRKLGLKANARGKLHSDAILAAYAVENDATIASSDKNFRLFDGIKLVDPLSS
ncbi:MAG: TA system VapC family ribonuclease toxin, partial [Pyrinomonadaceae bacterium]